MSLDLLRNPLVGTGEPVPDRDPSVRDFHRRFDDYRPSPLIRLDRLAGECGVGHLLLKDESDRLGLPAFKMLGASWASYRELVRVLGAEPEPWSTLAELAHRLAPVAGMDLATATDGNHGRAVASFARRVGLGARIFVPAGTSQARIDAILGEGATCQVVDGSYEDAVARAAQEASDDCLVISDTSWPGYETVPQWVIDGYATIFAELDEQLAAVGAVAGSASTTAPSLVVIPMGVGAFAAAAARWYRGGARRGTVLLGVEPRTADCVMASARAGRPVEVPGPHLSIMAGLNCGRPSPVAWPVVSHAFDWFSAIDDEDTVTAMRELAKDGVVSGETGAASLAAVLGLARGRDDGGHAALGLGPEATVVVISTEGATDPAAYTTEVGATPEQVALHAPPCAASDPRPCPVSGCPDPCRLPGGSSGQAG